MALDTLRKGAARTLGLILVGLLVISFAIWGIADIFTGYGRQTLIRVGDTEITNQDYLRAQQEVLRAMSSQAGRSLSLQEARALGLDSRVLERLVGGAAVDNHAKELHLGIADALLLEDTTKDPAFKDVLGNLLKEDRDFRTDLGGQFKAFKADLLPELTRDEFADIYAETITYGMFAARLHDETLDSFSRREALELLPKSNPFLRDLFAYIAGPALDDRIAWVIDDLADQTTRNALALFESCG